MRPERQFFKRVPGGRGLFFGGIGFAAGSEALQQQVGDLLRKRRRVRQRASFGQQRLVEQHLRVGLQLRRVFIRGINLEQRLDQRMFRIQLENPLALRNLLVHRLEQPLEMRRKRVALGDQAARAVGQPRNGPR